MISAFGELSSALIIWCRKLTSESPNRLEPVILELEREPADILFVGHASVIRCVLAYLQVRPSRSSRDRPIADLAFL